MQAKETKVPAECSLLSSVQCIRELVDEQRLKMLYWIDTRDMLPDGLTKGSVDRSALLTVISKNYWRQVGDKPTVLSAFIAASPHYYDDVDCLRISYVCREWVWLGLCDLLALRAAGPNGS